MNINVCHHSATVRIAVPPHSRIFTRSEWQKVVLVAGGCWGRTLNPNGSYFASQQ